MKGIFEVHLITTYEHQTKLFAFITDLDDKRLIRPRPTCAQALYGDHPVQPMLTTWINGTIDDIKSMVELLRLDMIDKGIPIIRTKIEAMAHNEGVPNECIDDHYFEFHFKVPISNTAQWNDIVRLIIPFGGHLFYNPYSKTLNPIVTLRRYTSLPDLEEVYLNVKTILEKHNFVLTSLEKEYSVYDSNVNLDKNWLFLDDPINQITEISPKMLF